MTRKTAFLKGWSWFKFDNMGLVLVKKFKFYNSVAKGLKLKVRTFWGLIPTFLEVTGEKLNRVKAKNTIDNYTCSQDINH